MENRTEIGKAFKDKLTNLDKTPSDFVWTKIEKDLNKKKRRRVLFWLIPSLLLVGFLSTVAIINQDDQEKDRNAATQKRAKTETQVVKTSKTPSLKTKIVSPNKSSQTVSIQNSNTSDTTLIKKSKTVKLVKQSSKLISSTNEYEEYEVVKKYKIIVKKEKINIKKETKTKLIAGNKNVKPTIAQKKYPKKNIVSKHSKITHTKGNSTKTTPQPKEVTSSTSAIIGENSEPKIIENPSIITEIKKDSIIKRDSIPIKKRAVKKEKVVPEKIVVNTKPERRVYIYYGPAVFSSLNNISMIDPSLSKQPKSSPASTFYGVYIKSMYKKIGFRVGVSKINLQTSTQLNQDEVIPNYSNIALHQELTPSSVNSTFANSTNIQLVQKVSYYELPIEFNYALKKDASRLNIEVFGGFGTMILDQSKLEISSAEVSKQNIGEARNISKVNVASNVGIGFSYELTKALQIDINPLFKYYLNTFKNDNDTKPYSLSLQSGISYKF